MRRLILFVALSPLAAPGQIAGPVTGYVFDAGARGLRPILGIPGAARLGEVQPAPFETRLLAAAPAQDYVLAVNAAGQLHLGLTAGTAWNAVDDSLAGPEQIVFSPSGSAVLLV